MNTPVTATTRDFPELSAELKELLTNDALLKGDAPLHLKKVLETLGSANSQVAIDHVICRQIALLQDELQDAAASLLLQDPDRSALLEGFSGRFAATLRNHLLQFCAEGPSAAEEI